MDATLAYQLGGLAIGAVVGLIIFTVVPPSKIIDWLAQKVK